MNAPVSIEAAVDKREERRRLSTMSMMVTALRDMSEDVNRAKTLGDNDRALAFRALRGRLTLIEQQAEMLQEESVDLAIAAEIED